MFYLPNECPICEQGSVGFFRCKSKTMLLVCDECTAVWVDPTNIVLEMAHCFDETSFTLPGSTTSLKGGEWATKDEIRKSGWASFVAGEGEALWQIP